MSRSAADVDAGDEATTTLGLPANLAGAMSYSLTFVTGLAFYLLEEDEFVRFHAAQSTITFGGLFSVSLLFSLLEPFVAAVSGTVAAVLSATAFVVAVVAVGLWIGLMFSAYRGRRTAVPVVGRVVDGYI